MPKIFRLQIAFKNKQANIALTFYNDDTFIACYKDLMKRMQTMDDVVNSYFDGAGNNLMVRGTSIDYLLATDMAADLNAMVDIQTMTAEAQSKAERRMQVAANGRGAIQVGGH